MNSYALWHQELYRETMGLIIIFLISMGTIIFLLQKVNTKFTKAWISVKSWIFAAPLLFFVLGLPAPWPLFFITFVSILSSKTFFKMTGMYHRSWFVWLEYFFTFTLTYMIWSKQTSLFNVIPMLVLSTSCIIPLIRNNYKYMIQYIALTAMGFAFLGWSFMHLGLILELKHGAYILLYIYILSEINFNFSALYNRFLGKIKPFDKISPKFTVEGFLFGVIITLLTAWGMRHMLPDRSPQYWIAAGIIFSVFGCGGGLTLGIIRRDLGIKDSGVFIIGRDDILARVDKFIFSAPTFYYIYIFLQHWKGL